MVYLDYSATTITDKEVLNSFNKVVNEFPGNANSIHKLGMESKMLLDRATEQVSSLLKVKPNEVIFTSGASESNNLAILGTIDAFPNRGKHIITTKLEHSSVLETLRYLETKGYIIDYVKLDNEGKVDLNDLDYLLNDETSLVTICEVNSEIGIKQDVNEIGKIVKKYPKCVFHVDGTQAIGKKEIDLSNIDLYSFSSHKIYGLDGVGCLIKKEYLKLNPIIHGGKSQTIYRSGTPTVALDVSLAKALKLMLSNYEERYKIVLDNYNYLINELKNIDGVIINSNSNCVPHIINMSILGVKPETVLHALEQYEIYISTKTACSDKEDYSLSVLELTKDLEKAKSSFRVSISYLTTKEEIDYFLDKFKIIVKNLKGLGDK